MKANRALAAALLCSFAWAELPASGCGLTFSMPQNYFDGVSEEGFVSHWMQLGDLELAKSDKGIPLTVPLVLNFRSDRGSGTGAAGWSIPFEDARFYQTGEDGSYVMVQPDGLRVFFWKDPKRPDVLHGQSNWLATVEGNVVKARASCGWGLDFVQGKLAKIHYPKGQAPVEISRSPEKFEVESRGAILLSISRNTATPDQVEMRWADDEATLTLGKRPIIQVTAGKALVARLEDSLVGVRLKSGKVWHFTYELDDQLNPGLQIDGSAKKKYLWDPITNKIIKDDSFGYQHSKSGVTRTQESGRSESVFDDAASGVKKTTFGDGSSKELLVFTSGPFASLPRRVKYASPAGEVAVDEFSYDEKKRLIRRTRNGTVVSERKYEGESLSFYREGDVVAEIKNDDRSKSVTFLDPNAKKTRVFTINQQNQIESCVIKHQ